MKRYRRPYPPQPFKSNRRRPFFLVYPQTQKRFILCSVLIAAGACLIILELCLRPTLQRMAAHQVDLLCTQIVSRAVSDELARQDNAYDQLVRLSRSSSGSVTSVETDYAAVDQLKAGVTQRVLESLSNYTASTLKIPLGTLMNSIYLNGRGPEIPIRVVPSSTANVNIQSQFSAAGINQTLHQIVLTVEVDAAAILPGASSSIHVSTTFLIAETVIVGGVPNAYADLALPSLSGAMQKSP